VLPVLLVPSSPRKRQFFVINPHRALFFPFLCTLHFSPPTIACIASSLANHTSNTVLQHSDLSPSSYAFISPRSPLLPFYLPRHKRIMGSLFYIVSQGLLAARRLCILHTKLTLLQEPFTKHFTKTWVMMGPTWNVFRELSTAYPMVCTNFEYALRQTLIIPGHTFTALMAALRLKWNQTFDTIYPFGDRRQCHFESVWTFNLDDDLLLFSKLTNTQSVHLSLLRQRQVNFNDFEHCATPSPPSFDVPRDFPSPYWEPDLQLQDQERHIAFTRRILHDFNFQWRHILRNRYNDLTFRRLVCAIIRIVRMDFEIRELTGRRHGLYGPLVGVTDLPTWESLDVKMFRVGQSWISVAQDPADCIPMILQHHSACLNEVTGPTARLPDDEVRYLILTVRHVILCRARGNAFEWSEPQTLFNGIDPCSDRAITMLLLASFSGKPLQNLIHTLPVELQNKVLSNLAYGPVQAAKLGCILGLGSLFAWNDGRMVIQTEHGHKNRRPESPVESQIWFGDHTSGIVYRGYITTMRNIPKQIIG
jgi:hypothetical protein